MPWQHGRAYAQDLRERVFAASDAGLPVGRIAAMLFVSVFYVSKVLGRRRKTGEITARPQRCHVPRKLTEQCDAIRILAVLIAAADMDGVVGPPGWRVHQLKGNRAGTWSISVSGNWRLTFDVRRNLQPRLGGRPLMNRAPARITMAPPYPGAFIREEILDEFGLSVSEAAKVLDVCRATLSDLVTATRR